MSVQEEFAEAMDNGRVYTISTRDNISANGTLDILLETPAPVNELRVKLLAARSRVNAEFDVIKNVGSVSGGTALTPRNIKAVDSAPSATFTATENPSYTGGTTVFTSQLIANETSHLLGGDASVPSMILETGNNALFSIKNVSGAGGDVSLEVVVTERT